MTKPIEWINARDATSHESGFVDKKAMTSRRDDLGYRNRQALIAGHRPRPRMSACFAAGHSYRTLVTGLEAPVHVPGRAQTFGAGPCGHSRWTHRGHRVELAAGTPCNPTRLSVMLACLREGWSRGRRARAGRRELTLQDEDLEGAISRTTFDVGRGRGRDEGRP